jgi:hypothetical protein
MKRRSRHPKPEVEAALRHAEAHGWRVEQGGSHAWGKMFCPTNDAICGCGEYCITSVWSTPRSEGNHSRQLMRVVDRCVAARLMAAEAKAAEDQENG